MTNKATKYGLMTIAAVLLVAMAFAGAVSAAVTGDGTEASPYQITAADQWYSLANISYATAFPGDQTLIVDFDKFGKTSTSANKTYLLSANYTLGDDITLMNYNGVNPTKTWNNYYGVKGFAGNFDGMGHTITLDIDMLYVVNQTGKPTSQGGVFATSLGSNVRNFTLGGDIYTINEDSPEEVWYGTDAINYGGLIGSTDYATSETAITDVDCRVNFSVIFNYNKKSTWVAGIVGRTITKRINAVNCSYSGTVNGTVSNENPSNSPRLTGMFGHMGGSTTVGYDRITKCKFTGDINISGVVRAGDLQSANSGGAVYTNCISNGTIVLKDNADEIVGIFSGAKAGSSGNLIQLGITGKSGETVSAVGLKNAKLYLNDVLESMPYTFSSDDEKVTLTFDPINDDGITVYGGKFNTNQYILVNSQGKSKYLYYISTDNLEFKTSLKTEDAVEFTKKYGSMDDPLYLDNATDLLNLQKAINGDHGAIDATWGVLQYDVQYDLAAAALKEACVKVKSDITIDSPEFSGIPEVSGIFDGNGYTINCTISGSSPGYYGLIGKLYGTVKNLNVNVTTGSFNTGSSDSELYFGGLAGYIGSAAIVENLNVVLNGVTIQSKSATKYVGGLVGCNVNSAGYIKNVLITIYEPITVDDLSGDSYIGGISGLQDNGDDVSDSISVCYTNNGSLYGKSVGGLFGYGWGPLIFKGGKYYILGNNTGSILQGTYVGGIIGYLTTSSSTLDKVRFDADGSFVFDGKFKLQGTYTGGVIGYFYVMGTVKIANLKISDMVLTGTKNVGGIIGYSYSDIICNFTNCEVDTGALAVSGYKNGRYLGSVKTAVYITADNCLALSDDNDLQIVGNKTGDFGIYKNYILTTGSGSAEFGTTNETMIQSSSISNVTLENVTNLTGSSVTVEFIPVNSSVGNPPAQSGMQSTTLTIFEINVPGFTAGNVAEFNVSVTFNSDADATAKKDSIVFWHYNTTTSQWDNSPLTIVAKVQNGADVTYTVQTTSFSPFGIASETAIPQPTYSSSSSKQTGYTVILSEGQEVPTTTPTAAPTAEPTPATPTVIATEKPTTQATQQSPAPFLGILAGLGAAAVLLRLRK